VRALHLTRDFPPVANGGLSTAVGELLGSWPGCSVLSFEDWRPRATGLMDLPPPLPEAGPPPVLRLRAPGQLEFARRWARDVGADCLVVHDGFLFEFAAELRAEHGWPILLAVHVDHAALNAARGVTEQTQSLVLQRAALRDADAVVAPSRATAAAVSSRVDRAVGVAPLGAKRRAASGSHCSLLYAGRFDSSKGTDVLFTALPKILDALPDATVCIAGGLPASPKLERKWLNRQRETLAPWLDRIELPGWLGPLELARRYAGAELVVVPSRAETFGLVALEAMAHGAAVLASDLPVFHELLGTEGSPWVPPGDPLALQRAAIELMSNQARREELAEANAARAAAWTWEAAAPVWQQACRDMLTG